MEAILALLASEAGAAIVVGLAGVVATTIQSIRQKKARKAMRSAVDGLGFVALALETAQQQAATRGDEATVETVAAMKRRVAQLSKLADIEEQIVGPMVREVVDSIDEIRGELDELGIGHPAPDGPSNIDALTVVRRARERWEARRPSKPAKFTTNIMRGFGPLVLASGLALGSTGCATLDALCGDDPRIVGEVVVPPATDEDYLAIVLLLPAGAPSEIDWYVLDEVDGQATLAFPLFVEEAAAPASPEE